MQTTQATYDPFKGVPLEDVQQYQYELSCIPPMSMEEYHEVARCIRLARAGLVHAASGKRARERMILAHLRKVVLIAKHRLAATVDPKVSLLDLIQEGNSALVKMVDEFAYDEGVEIGGYIHTSVSWAVQQAIYTGYAIRVPDSSYRYALKQGRADDVRATHNVSSLDEIRNRKYGMQQDGGEATLLQFLAAPDETARVYNHIKEECVHLLLTLLPPRERETLQCRYGMGEEGTTYTLQETADRMHVTCSMVCQYERRAIAHIQGIFQTYQLEAGQKSTLFPAHRAFLAYLQGKTAQDFPSTKTVLDLKTIARLDNVYAGLQKQDVKITTRLLATTAQINTAKAGLYLRLREQVALAPISITSTPKKARA